MAGCEFKGKQRFTHREATERARDLNRFAFDGRAVHAYRCSAGGPGEPGHWHVGHPRRKPGPRLRRGQR